MNEVRIFLQNNMNNNGDDKNEIEAKSTRKCQYFIDIIFRMDDPIIPD